MGLFSGLMGHGSEIDASDVERLTEGLLVEGERVTHAFRGMTGSKVDYRTIPYRAIVGFSVETAGTFDFDAELKIWVSGSPGPIEKTLKRGTDMRAIQRCLAAGACR